ncbi:MAG: hypothetical protein J6031_04915 [Bacteroidales bacterium]|nr:hypothetical protein [Bacteroidales bacterium]
MMFRKTLLTFLLVVSAVVVWGQSGDNGAGKNDTTFVLLSARDLCGNYQVDARIVDDDNALRSIIDSLQRVQPNAYPLIAQWCRQQQLRINRMVRSFNNDYTRSAGVIWMDSMHCITDAEQYIVKLEKTATTLQSESERYNQLEQERLEAERRAAEERARVEAARIQREKDLQLATMKDTIRAMHKTITNVCDAKGVSDKTRVKELKDIYYAYLAVYNRYDLTDDNTTDSHFRQLDELQVFQNELIDSVLGSNSYTDRIEAFKNTLHLRSGKDHNDVNKSYQRVFKKVQIPISFKTIAEYYEYTAQLREVLAVQQSYLKVIDLRDSISHNTHNLQQQCAKNHKDIFNSYKEILAEVNQIPAYTTLDESSKFIANLNDFINVQHNFSAVVRRIDAIEARGDSIVAICSKNIGDVATAYLELVAANDFVPRFINQASANHFNNKLDEFEQLQQMYINVVGIRNTIESGTQAITGNKNAPRGLVPGYRQMMKYTDFTPHFTNRKGAEDFTKLLYHFIDIQQKFVQIVNNNNTIEANTKQFRVAFKEYANINKAYERLLKTYDKELNIISEADLNSYLDHQSEVLAMQERFTALAGSLDKEDYNNRLKKVKEPDKIKLIMAVK